MLIQGYVWNHHFVREVRQKMDMSHSDQLRPPCLQAVSGSLPPAPTLPPPNLPQQAAAYSTQLSTKFRNNKSIPRPAGAPTIAVHDALQGLCPGRRDTNS